LGFVLDEDCEGHENSVRGLGAAAAERLAILAILAISRPGSSRTRPSAS